MVITSKTPNLDPIARIRQTVARVKHYIWEIPEGVIELSLREGQLEPEFSVRRRGRLRAALAYLIDKISAVQEHDWTRAELDVVMQAAMHEDVYREMTEDLGIKKHRAVFKPLRWALLVGEKGLPMAHTMEILGREETLKRLETAKAIVDKVIAEDEGLAVGEQHKPLLVKGTDSILAAGQTAAMESGEAPAAEAETQKQ
ncbi:hypothetical protein VTI74DRAFT_1149 [Chaetomium olivicolor]